MAEIKAADVAKLRKMTGAGMMDCKKALKESNGDFDAAIDILRKKGQKVASKRVDNEANEGAVIAKTSDCKKVGGIIVLKCETDFVAKNDDFVKFAHALANIAIKERAKDVEALKAAKYNDQTTVEDEIVNQIGIIGEKIELTECKVLEDEYVAAYIHQGNQDASIAAFNKLADEEVGKNIVMQIAAMKPVAVNQEQVPQDIIDKELEIGKELAIQEGKPADLAEKIARGRLNKFFKEATLLNQQFVKDTKKSIKQYLQESEKGLTVTDFVRFSLRD